MFVPRNIDPELEKLRKEADGPPNLDTVILNIQRAAARIHASYLFEQSGKPMLQKLCLLLSSTATGKVYSSWQEFATDLGLTMEQIRCIDYDFKGLQDPTYYVLLAYVQQTDATLDKILNTLQKMQRFDIINQIKNDIYALIDAISLNNTTDESTMLRLKNIPKAPLVLTPIEVVQGIQRGTINSEPISQNTLQKTKRSYGCIVMLTFADDGSETATHIAKIFRSQEPRIGVIILEEQKHHVYQKAEQFIDDCFLQTHFIIPILTRGYLEKINSSETCVDDHSKLDTKYLKYIYCLLRNEYVWNQCRNYRVRCIVPDKEIHTIPKTYLHLTLQAWFKESNINEFVANILLRKYSK